MSVGHDNSVELRARFFLPLFIFSIIIVSENAVRRRATRKESRGLGRKRNEMETKQLGIENTWPGLRASGPGGTITTWLQAHDTSERHSKPTNVEMHMTHMCDNCISGK